ncbi:aldehyde ferredoxin oxidoreductase C-terminal domain-containing protein [Haloplanus halobius]|uniref:aldehyde ferredoxin oxidoreductase C-terminal domain-containing protein n=1 Tax=Haloplanus halobius TaxID=2934938 RepID=UPI00200F74CB|nr:aldehyde ferredoxin oxidoreductase C-terminal domain-containing protein [Haloplanus sp. XH21]
MRHARGPLLTIDVGTREWRTERIDDVLDTYVGGRGVGTRLAYERIPFDADPFGPENRLCFTAGPLQTATTSFAGRLSCTGLSPLTNGLLSSNAGGFLAGNFVGAGYPAVELVGESDDLLAVHVREDGVAFEPVPDLTGAEVSTVTAWARDDHDLSAEHVACVGPAGENRVRFAAIMTTEHRAFARGGLGAALGAKGVKAVTWDGDADPGPDLDAAAETVASAVHREAAESDHVMKDQGTASLTSFASEVGALPTRYFSERSFEGADAIGGEQVAAKKEGRGTCARCAFACKLPTSDEETGIETEGPEFETIMAFGSNAGVDDLPAVMHANDRCDELGLDTISCGDVVSAYLAAEDAFGDAELVHDLLEKIARREGVGDRLAEGIHRCHDALGVADWTMKGMEFAAHDGRALAGQALAFATSNRGADHLYGSLYVYEYPLVDREDALPADELDGKAAKLVESENHNAAMDAAIACRFSRGTLTDERLRTLLDADPGDLQALGARIVDLERGFNNRRGRDRRDDDALPYALDGLDAALDTYYGRRGWTTEGVVPEKRRERLLGE